MLEENDCTGVAFDYVEHETAAAYLVEFEPGVRHWIPKSQVYSIGDKDMMLADWIIDEKDLTGYIIPF